MNTTLGFNACVRDEADLLKLEMQIARRADELVQRCHLSYRNRVIDLTCWLEAERDVLAAKATRAHRRRALHRAPTRWQPDLVFAPSIRC